MRRRLLIVLIFFLFAWLIAITQLSFIDSLSGFWGQINLVFLALTFVLFFLDLNNALVFAIILGLFLDFFSFHTFGFHLSLLLLSVFILHLLLINWFTNRSFYSLVALSAIAIIISRILGAIILMITSAWGPDKAIFVFLHWFWWRQMLWQVLTSFILTLLLFNLMNILSYRLKPFFLAKK